MSTAKKQALPADVKIILIVLVGAALVMFLNETILSVALPSIMADFSIPATTAQWLTTGFMLTMAVVIPTTGWILQRFTTKQVFLAAVTSFLVGTVVAAWAPTFIALLVGRIVQATGTALIMPLLMTVAMTVVPANRRGSIMGVISIVMSAAPALGPTVSGFILNRFTWHWLFWLVVPLIAVALVVGAVFIRNIGETSRSPLDPLSVVLAGLGFGGLVYALSTLGTNPTVAVGVAVVGALSLAVFVWRQIRLETPLLDLRPFTIRNYTLSVIVALLLMGTLLGVAMVLPIYLQTALGVTALVTGLLVMPGGLASGILAPFIGRLYDRVGPRPLVIPGALLLFGAVWAMTRLDINSTTTEVIIMHMVFSLGLALMMTPLMTTALGSLPKHLYGHGSAILNTLQQLAGAAGTAILIAALSFGTQAAMSGGADLAQATADGAHSAFIVAGVMAALVLVASPFVTKVAEEQQEEGQAS
ncbi:MFS transporter, DHA2 family, lincomycin resistance protein [Corynebacterium pollutisoli]|uniref:MFS transporter, DHA2 family, lincomycin resistance protein n=1 Tax=Corynebacterium pollutisoli TaxID=1610489 RepID=A0A1X7J496_9CORY|nr:MDR family MFS transporter [Corynebacterium pollutisoli]SMG22096.1 MFS transporter, DHA2 family, lincomycin resistance protein [Corynebacterium pollutisoli]